MGESAVFWKVGCCDEKSVSNNRKTSLCGFTCLPADRSADIVRFSAKASWPKARADFSTSAIIVLCHDHGGYGFRGPETVRDPQLQRGVVFGKERHFIRVQRRAYRHCAFAQSRGLDGVPCREELGTSR